MDLDLASTVKSTIDITDKDSWIHRWESRSKIVSCTIMVFGLVALETPKLLIGAYFLLLIILLMMGFSIKGLIKKTSYILPFVIFMSIPLLLGGGMPPSDQRIRLTLLLVLKGLNSLYIMLMMFYSQPPSELQNGLAGMKLPSSFITILFLSWRYIFLLSEKLTSLYKALLSRLFKPSIGKNAFKTYGQVMGGMLIKSIDTSDKVYKAMASRGFNGTMPTSAPKEIGYLDLMKSVIMISFVIALNIFEKWWY